MPLINVIMCSLLPATDELTAHTSSPHLLFSLFIQMLLGFLNLSLFSAVHTVSSVCCPSGTIIIQSDLLFTGFMYKFTFTLYIYITSHTLYNYSSPYGVSPAIQLKSMRGAIIKAMLTLE